MTAPAPSADTVTVLRTVSSRLLMAKQFTIAANGQVVKRDYSNAATFRVEEAPANGIGDLFRILQRVERDPSACVIRGKPIEGTNLAATSRKKQENGGNFADVLRHWVMLDLDRVTIPAATSVLEEPESVARLVVDLIASHVPELDGVSSVVHFSSSAGLGEMADAEVAAGMPPRWKGVAKPSNVVGAHAWFWLARPVTGAELDRWHHAVNAAAGHKFIDPVTLRTVQPHYTAAPVFGEGLRDPMPGYRTVLVEGEADAATLTIPPVVARKPYEPGQANTDGRGYSGWLEAIGGIEGFHTPINRAIASFVATNWPRPDTEALKAALIAHIHAADPGDRTPADIERYASEAGLDARIAWTMGREQAKQDERAAADAEAAAQPIPPTYPDRGMSLDEAKALALDLIAEFARQIVAGETPQLLLRMTVGGGKTFAVIEALPSILTAGRQAGRGPILFTHPRHTLGDQIAADIRARHLNLKIAVWRGMTAADPDNPGKQMCQDPVLPAAARKAGLSANHGCGVCPLAETCSYLRQAPLARQADVVVAPHQTLFQTPFAGWPRITVDGKKRPVPPSAVIVDEDIASSGLRGASQSELPTQLAIAALHSDTTLNLTGGDRERLLYLRRKLIESLEGHQQGKLFRGPVEWMGVEPAEIGGITPARELALLEWETKPRVKLPKGTTRAEAIAAYEYAAEQGFTKLRPLLAERIATFLATGDARSVNLIFDPEAKLMRRQETGPAMRFSWREDIHPGWAAPLLFLDATAQGEVLRHWAPRLEVTDIEVVAPHQYVIQVPSHEFGRRMLMQPGNLSALADVLMVELAQAGGSVLAVAQIGVERLLRPYLEGRPAEGDQPAIKGRGAVRDALQGDEDEDAPAIYRFPSGAVLHLAHHGAVTGSNAWQDVAGVVVIGRPAMDRPTGERYAEVISGKAGVVVADAATSWWPATTAATRMTDGTGYPVTRQPTHPNPLTEAYRWTVTEGAVLQAIGRARGVRRTAKAPVRVVVLAALALPLTVAEVATWDDFKPDRLTVASAEAALHQRAMPLGAADMHQARSDLWATVKAAERFLEESAKASKTPQSLIYNLTYKGLGGLRGLTGARYRKSGARVFSKALVPLVDGEAALSALLGPLAAYETVRPEASPQAAEPEAPQADFRPPRSAPAWWDEPAVTTAPLPATVADVDWLTAEPAKPRPQPTVPVIADDDGIDWLKPPPVLHPPLPGEDLQPHRPPPSQAGLLGVIPGRQATQTDPYPEPGSYEPDEDVPFEGINGLPQEAPEAWRAAWAADLQRRLSGWPPPDLTPGWPLSQLRTADWLIATEPTRAQWRRDWKAAWRAGRAMPAAVGEGS